MHEISHHAKEENNQWKNPKIVKTVFEVKALENTKLKLKNSLRWTSPPRELFRLRKACKMQALNIPKFICWENEKNI